MGQVVNLGNPESISIEDLAGMVIELTGSESGIKYVPYEEAYPVGFEDMAARAPDITNARNLVGFEPRTGLGESIRRIHEHMSAKQRG